MSNEKTMFETLLASTVHDMKNSLSLLMNNLQIINERLQDNDENQREVSSLRYEANRINISLMELLTLYKLERKQIAVQIEEVIVADLIDDCIAAHSLLATQNGLKLEFDCDESLIWFFDPNLVSIVLNNAIGNSLRYTKSQVLVSTTFDDGLLTIQVDDDGPGYPKTMLEQPENFQQKIDYTTGSTGLGLYFASSIAQNHHRQGKQGSIILQNAKRLNGGSFQINLP